MRFWATVVAIAAALALAACGGDDEVVSLPSTTTTGASGATGATGEAGTTGTGSGAAVETALTDAGFGISSVTCPEDVPLEEGDTFDCDFTVDSGDSGTISVTVDSADETTATLSYESDSPQVEGQGVEVEK
jgi:hypothetical protein